MVEMRGTIQDVTELKRAEMEAKAAKSFLESVVDKSPFAMWVADPEGTLIKTNHALRQILDLSDEQLIGRYNVFQDENVIEQGLLPKIKTVFNKRQTIRFTLTWNAAKVKTIDQEENRDRYLEISMFPIVDAREMLANVVCQWIDITELKHAEQALNDSKERLDRIINASPFGICTVDTKNNFVTTNRAYEKMLGYSEKELSKLSLLDITVPEYRPKNKKLYEKLFSAPGGSFDMEKKYIRKDGTTIDVSVHATAVKGRNGGKDGWRCFCRGHNPAQTRGKRACYLPETPGRSCYSQDPGTGRGQQGT